MVEDHVLAAPSEHLPGSESRDPLGGRVPVQEAPVTVDEIHPVAQVLEQRTADFATEADRLELPDLVLVPSDHAPASSNFTGPVVPTVANNIGRSDGKLSADLQSAEAGRIEGLDVAWSSGARRVVAPTR